MNAKKIDIANDVIKIVRDLCHTVFNISSDDELQKVLGITKEQLGIVVKRIIGGLPDALFDTLGKKQLEEIKNIAAREFIFFQSQERWDNPHYKDNLLNFIHVFSRDIREGYEG